MHDRGQATNRNLYDEDGQATTEYAVLVFWSVILTYGVIKALQVALLYYYQDLVSLICLPIP